MQKYFFTSDTHFGHTNVIRYSNRPFKNSEEMDETIIRNWNDKVSPGDTIFHMGDVFFCSEQRAASILDRLNGQKFLIFGNHDKTILKSKLLQSKFVKCAHYYELRVEDQKIVMSHYPMITWNAAHHGSWMLHGHCHGNLKYPAPAKIYDVGTDPNKFFPIEYSDLKKIMDAKPLNKVDHHGD